MKPQLKTQQQLLGSSKAESKPKLWHVAFEQMEIYGKDNKASQYGAFHMVLQIEGTSSIWPLLMAQRECMR